MRYRLRALLIALAVLPPLIAVSWMRYSASLEFARRKADWQRSEAMRIYRVTDEPMLQRLPVPPLPTP
jgi:hypothetical protein